MPIQGMKRATAMSVLSAQERTKSTMVSRVSWGTQHLFSVPHFFFFLGESFHELSHDLVLARELGFELLDFLVLGVLGRRQSHDQNVGLADRQGSHHRGRPPIGS